MLFLSLLQESLSLLLVAIALCYLLWSFISYTRLSHIPGPTLWAWTRLPLIHIHAIGETYEGYYDLSRQYGPLVRIGPNYLLSSDPNVIRRINSSKPMYKKSSWYVQGRLTPGVDNMLSTRDEKIHEMLRKKTAAGYNGKGNIHLEPNIDECILDFMHLIETKYLSNKTQDVKMEFAEKAQYFTNDVGSKLAFDVKMENLRYDRDNFGLITEFTKIFPTIFTTSVMPEIIEFLTKTGILKLFDPAKSNLAIGKLLRVCKTQIASRFDSHGEPIDTNYDILGSFIRHGLNRQELEQESVLLMAAGTDTVGGAIKATMLCLLTHPKALERLLAEIDDAVREHKISNGPNEVVPDAQAKQMQYLQAVIKEGMRWCPPIVGLGGKETPPEGDILSGYHVPGGTIVGYSAKAIHYSPKLFGPDPAEFRPERWIHTSCKGDEPSWERLKEMERNNDLLFGYGKNSCVGKAIAFLELNKIFVELLRRFEFDLVDKAKPWETKSYGIHIQSGLWVRVKRRSAVDRSLSAERSYLKLG